MSRGLGLELAYRAITVDYTLAAARAAPAANPKLVFRYVSGAGTAGTGKARMMWVRVKGELENTLIALTPRSYMFRPAFFLLLPGGKAKSKSYVLLYRIVTPLYLMLRRVAPRYVITSLQLGQAMIEVTRSGTSRRILDTVGRTTPHLTPNDPWINAFRASLVRHPEAAHVFMPFEQLIGSQGGASGGGSRRCRPRRQLDGNQLVLSVGSGPTCAAPLSRRLSFCLLCS